MGNSSPSESPPPTSKDGKDIGHWVSSRWRPRVKPGAINLKANIYKDFSIHVLWECGTQELDRKIPDAGSRGLRKQQHPAFPQVKDLSLQMAK